MGAPIGPQPVSLFSTLPFQANHCKPLNNPERITQTLASDPVTDWVDQNLLVVSLNTGSFKTLPSCFN